MAKDKVADKTIDKKAKADDEKPPKKVADKGADKKVTKPPKNDDAEKVPKVYPNKDTIRANLHFNVKTTNKWLREYYSSYAVEKKKKKDKDEKGKKQPDGDEQEKKDDSIKMNGGHYALTAVDEALCIEMANLAFGRTIKDKAGLYLIKEETVMDSMKLNKDFAFSFGKFFDAYSSKEKYGKQLGIEKKDVLKLLESCAFGGGNTSVNIDDSAYNLMMYVVVKNRILVAETAYQMLLYSKKASVDGKAIIHSVRAVYAGTTELHKTLSRKAEATNTLVKGEKLKEEPEDGDGDKKPKKETKGTKKDVKGQKKEEKKNGKKDEDSASESEPDAKGEKSASESDSESSDED